MTSAFDMFAEQLSTYGYPVLFAGVLLENIGIPVPGETAVLVAGFLSSPAGGSHFNIVWVIGLTVIAAVIGDNIGFWLGHRFARPRLQTGRGFLFLTPKTLALAEDYFRRYGLWTIFFARFITGLRVIGALAAGTAGMPWPRFLVANATGAVAWAVTMALLGYFFGHSWELLHDRLGKGGLIVLGCVIVLVGLPYLLRRLRHMQFRPLERVTRGEIVQGLLAALLEVVCVGLLALMSDQRQTLRLDREVADWLAEHPSDTVKMVAQVGEFIGSLPVVTLWTLLMLAWLWRRARPWRESAAAAWALVGSEALGLVLVGIIHLRAVRPVYVNEWPYGYAGLVPMRAFAVAGMSAYLAARQWPVYGRALKGIALLLVWLAAFGVVWMGTQTLTETLLELAAGGLVLFAGLWWLEGFGRGLVEPAPGTSGGPPPQESVGIQQP
jgi:membrane-associated protein